MLVVGLTGGIGSGKSEAARFFTELGVAVIDADAIVHKLTQAGTDTFNTIVDLFGESIVNAEGELDRTRLADIVFHDHAKKQQLEAIIHPQVRQQIREFKQAHSSEPYIVVVIPLLIESGQSDLVDRILVIHADEAVRINRVTNRDTRSKQQIISIINSQASDAEREAAADDNLDNNGTLEELRNAVAQLHDKYCSDTG